jgi:hypothetical protein
VVVSSLLLPYVFNKPLDESGTRFSYVPFRFGDLERHFNPEPDHIREIRTVVTGARMLYLIFLQCQ